jgi:SAM-dependent methyltransferase
MEPGEYALMDAAEERMWWYRALHARLTGALVGINGRVLDAGCGTGGFLARLGEQRPDLQLAGIEWQQSAALRARAKAGAKTGAMILRGSVDALPFRDASFDAAVCADVLCHAAVRPAEALAELYRVLRPGGRLVVNMPAYRWLTSAHDAQVHNVRRQTAREVSAMLRGGGFRVVASRYWNTLLLPLMVLQRKVLLSGKKSDVAVFPPSLDAMFHLMTEVERRLPIGLPAGGSVLAIAERP